MKIGDSRVVIMFITGLVMGAASLLLSLTVPQVAGAASAEGKQAFQKLVEAVKKEGQLDLPTGTLAEKGAKEMTEAFKRRFGLTINVASTTGTMESQEFNKAVAETKGGIPPTYDLLDGSAENVLNLIDAGGAEPIANWEILLAEIVPEAYLVRHGVSPGPLAGYGFVWSTRTLALLFNPKLISERELPRTWKEKGDPKYKGAFSVPPWISAATMGILSYNKDEWLDIIRAVGRNKRDVLTYDAGVQLMMLGELRFLYGNAGQFFEHKLRDPNAPIGMTFFSDITTVRQVMYVVRKGARHPNAAKLFTLWASSAEAGRIFDKDSSIENVVLGKGATTEKIVAVLKERNIKPLSWFDNSQTLEKLRWFETKEGRDYARALATAQREGK